jgi:hypothetical protein
VASLVPDFGRRPTIEEGLMDTGSTRAQVRTAIVLGVIAAIALFVVGTGVLNSPTVYFRNESSIEVDVVVQVNPGSYGANVVLTVPPWTEGTCATGSWSMGIGNRPQQAYLVMQGHTMTFPPGGPYYVRVDASGAMHLGEPVPTDPVGCKVYLVTLR